MAFPLEKDTAQPSVVRFPRTPVANAPKPQVVPALETAEPAAMWGFTEEELDEIDAEFDELFEKRGGALIF
jgi:hypothetical protein